MKNKLASAIVSLVALVALGLFAVRRKNRQKFIQQVKNLFASAENVSAQTFSYHQLKGLPAPVQRYFRFALPEGYPYISSLRLRHGGQFKTGIDKDWIPIEGEEYFTAQPPGFIWRGKTSLFTATDRYVEGKGQLVVKLLSLIEVARASGAEADQGELLRWVGETVWFPTSLLPGELLRWSTVNDDTALLTFTDQELTVDLKVSFTETGEITRVEAQRYFTPQRLETWVGELSDYQKIEQVQLPTRIKATCKLAEGDFTYVDFKVQEIQFNNSSPY